jgi:hypothetical protein
VLKAMAFTVASYGVWGGVGGVLHGIESSFTTASVLVSSAVPPSARSSPEPQAVPPPNSPAASS